ncbi:MAG: hypothetical protein JW910_09715, partial [Anaerolineae bacterium]|nr:hypothetical protein [Anaerolineae bacterium]
GQIVFGNSTIANNETPHGDGGGVELIAATLTVQNMLFDGNRCHIRGGGLFNEAGTVEINETTFTHNVADGSWSGGGLNNGPDGTVTITNSAFISNDEFDGGGALYSEGSLYIADTVFDYNQGAIRGEGIITLDHIAITNDLGTVLQVSGGTVERPTYLSLNDSTLSNNAGGGYPIVRLGGDFLTAYISHSTIDNNGNTAVYVVNGSMVTVINSTLSNNSGYGLEISPGGAVVVNSTIYGNRRSALRPFNDAATLTVANSLIGGTQRDANCSTPFDGFVNSGGGNISDDASCADWLDEPTDWNDVDLLLGPLADYGGPTLTCALLPGSPAINWGDPMICAGTLVNSVDQRRVIRPQGLACDSGSFELTGDALGLTYNYGLNVLLGESGVIDHSRLLVIDVNTPPAQLVYSVLTEPTAGMLSLGGTFTQQDIDTAALTYTHTGTELGMDSFEFTVTDGINVIGPYTFAITIDNAVPELVMNTGLTVLFDHTASIDATRLRAIDENQGPGELVYTVTAGPHEGTLNLGGTFTQQDINDGLLSYTHDPALLPPSLERPGALYETDGFTFTVSDGYATIGPFTFDIEITIDVLTTGWYEEWHPLLHYNSQWKFKAKAAASGGMAAKATSGALLEFWFEGDVLVIVRHIGPLDGDMQVCVDEVCQVVSNDAAIGEWQAPVAFGPFLAGVHEVEISRPADEAAFWFDAVQIVNLDNPLLTGVLYQEFDSAFFYVTAWQYKAKTAALGGGVNKAKSVDSAVFFSFEGTEFTLYRRIGPNDGMMRVCIDNACQDISNTSAVKLWGQPVTFSGLSVGWHVVGVYRIPGSKLFFDAAWVGPGAPVGGANPTVTPRPTEPALPPTEPPVTRPPISTATPMPSPTATPTAPRHLQDSSS